MTIDTHLHIVTPEFVSAVRAAGDDAAGKFVPAWSPELALEFMDSQNTTKGILSFTSPGPLIGGPRLVRQSNEYMKSVARDHPSRFGWFASLPDWDTTSGLDAVIDEITWALQEAGADGISMMTTYQDKLIGHEDFRPIWDKLDELHAIVFVHPSAISVTPRLIASKVAQPLVDYPLATTRAAVDLVLTKTFSLHPNVKVILSHAGGVLPFLAERIITLCPLFELSEEECRRDIQRFYVDTGLSTSKAQLMALTAIIPSDHILYGSDWPYVSQSAASSGVQDLQSFIGGGCCCGGFGQPHDPPQSTEPSRRREELDGLWRRNAEKLFGWVNSIP